MNIAMVGMSRCLFRLGKRLPAVLECQAAEAFKLFLTRHGITSLIFHGEDQRCIRPFLSKHNISLDSIKMHSTVTFFTTLEQNRLGIFHPIVVKTNLELMVTIYANEKTKKRYTAEKHSALVDALTLFSMVLSSDLKVDFVEWLSSSVASL